MESQQRSFFSLGFWTNIFWKCNSATLVRSSLLTRVVLMLFAASYVHLACGRPVSNDHQLNGGGHGRRGVYEGLSEQSQIDGTQYLMRYGYLPGSDLETGALRTDEELQRAIRNFQKFARIPETGRLDENTMEEMRRPRCGMADLLPDHGHHRHHMDSEIGPPSGYTLGPSKWQKKWLTVRLLNFTPDLNYQHTRDAIIRALYVWSDVTDLSFHEVQSGHADIYIQFSSGYHQDGYPFDGPGMVLAHAFFPGDDRGGDIHFDEDERWTIRSDQGVNLFMVAAHELGHSLGLAHSNVPGSLMFPWHQGYTPDFKLHPDDIIAIQYLYGPKKPYQKPPFYPVSTSSTHRPPHHPAPTHPAPTHPAPTHPAPTHPAPTYPAQTHRPHHPHHPHTLPPVPTTTTSREPFSSATSRNWPVPSSTTPTRSTTSGTRTSTVAPVVTTHKRHGHGSHDGHDDGGHNGRGGNDGHGGHNGHGGHGRPSSTTTARPLSDPSIPDPCHSIDALSVIRGETFLFSGKWFWRINDRGIMDGFPVQISRFWYGFPPQVQNVDALFERSSDGKIIFFSGNKYWEFNGNYLVGGLSAESGKPISDFGLPADVDHIDAAFVWGHNRRTYVINGDMYWKLNETGHGIETYNYPRDMSMWSGVSLPVDAAFTYTDGHTYFFKGSEYWQFNNARMHVRHGYPKPIGDKWLKCEPKDRSTATEITETATKVFARQSSGEMSRIVPLPIAIILMLLMVKILD